MTTAAIIAVLIAVESGGNPDAVGDVGRRGGLARGVLQIRSGMRDEYFRLTGLYVSDRSLYDAPTSQRIARTILEHHARRIGRPLTLREACAVWNAGRVVPRASQRAAVERYYKRALAVQRGRAR